MPPFDTKEDLFAFLDGGPSPEKRKLFDFLDKDVPPVGSIQDPDPKDPFGFSTAFTNMPGTIFGQAADKPAVVRKEFRPTPISGEQDFLRGLAGRATSMQNFMMNLIAGKKGFEEGPQRKVGLQIFENVDPDLLDRAAEFAGEFAPEIIGGGLTAAGSAASAAARFGLGATQSATEDVISGRSPGEIALGAAAGGGAAALLFPRGPTKKAAQKGLAKLMGEVGPPQGELFDTALRRTLDGVKKSEVVPEPARVTAEVLEREGQLTLQSAADSANLDEIIQKATSKAHNAIDVIDENAARGATVSQIIEVPGPQRLLPPGKVHAIAKQLPEFTERRSGLRLLSNMSSRTQRFLTAGSLNMEVVRSALASGETPGFRTALQSLGLGPDEAETIITDTIKNLTKAQKGKIASKETRGEAYLKVWDDLTRAPEVVQPGGKVRLLGKSYDSVDAAGKVADAAAAPERVALAETRAAVPKVAVDQRNPLGPAGPFFRSRLEEGEFAIRKTDLTGEKAFRAKGSAKEPFSALKIADVVVQKTLRAGRLNKKQIEEFLNRMTDAERIRMAAELDFGRVSMTDIGAKAMREFGTGTRKNISFINAQSLVKKALSKAKVRMGIFAKEESGMIRLPRIIAATPRSGEAVAKTMSQLIDKVNTGKGPRVAEALYFNALLSSPFGRSKDVFSSALNSFAQVGGRFARNPRAALAQFSSRNQGNAISAAFPTAMEGWRTGVSKVVRDMVIDGDMPEELIETAVRLDQFDGPTFLKILKQIPFTPSRINATADDFFSQVGYMMEKNFLSMQKALRSGKKGEALQSLYESIVRSDDTIDAQALEMGRRITFREKKLSTFSTFGIAAGNAVRKLPYGFGRYVAAPFVRTPVNVASRALETVPNPFTIMEIGIDAFKALSKGDVGAADRAVFGVMKQTLGAMGLWAGVDLAQQGRLTGRGDHLGPAEKDALMRAGKWRPNSLWIMDRWIPYSGIGPISAWASAAANLYERQQNGEMESTFAAMSLLQQEAIAGALEATFLPGFARLIDSFISPRKYGKTFNERMANSFGAIGVMKAAATALDPERRDPQTIGEGIMAVIPGLRGNVPIKAGTFGEANPVEGNPVVNFFFPRIGRASDDPLIVHLMSIDALPGRPAIPQAPKGLGRDAKNAFKFDRNEKNEIRLAKGKIEREIIERIILNSGGLEKFAERDPRVQKLQVARARNLRNGQVNRIIRNLRLAGQPITERAIRLGLGE